MINSLLHKIGVGVVTLGIAVSSFFGFNHTPQQTLAPLGAAPQFAAAKPTALYGGGITSSATTIKLTGLVSPDGTAITTANLIGGVGSVFYITIEPATTKKETVSCTAVTQNSDSTATLTGCTRGLGFVYPYTAVTALAVSHAGGSSVVLSNSPQLYNDIIAYVNSSLAGGVNNASLIAKGIGQLASGLQQASSTAIGGGSTDAGLLLYTANSTSTFNSATAGLKTVVTQNNGKIDPNFISTSTLYGPAGAGLASTTGIGSFPAFFIGTNYQVITSTGTSTFSVPSGVTRLHVKLVGGGGGGGGSGCASAGCGGGGGGYAEGIVDLSFGAAPIAGTTSIQVFVGTSGQWSTFGTNGYFLSGNSGLGASATNGGTSAVGAGTANVLGPILITGGNGQPNPRTASAASIYGSGGSTPLGIGGVGKNDDGTFACTAGTGYGSGGGAISCGGQNGIVIVNW